MSGLKWSASSPRSDAPGRCGGCPARWTGLNMCHCSVCHQTYGGPSVFDRHQPKGNCTDPETIDGFYESRPGVWSYAKPVG